MLKRKCLNSSIRLILASALLTTPSLNLAHEIQLPEMGTIASNALTIDKELEYGDAYMRMLRASRPVINDPLLQNYIDMLGHKLVANSENVKTPFHFFFIRDNEINAFAFFGGYVAIHSGLVLATHTESELASVLAHEIAHITQRHLARQLAEQAVSGPLTAAALIGSVILATAGAAPVAGIAAFNASAALSLQNSINFTRENETEADRMGMQALARSNYDVSAMARFMRRLQEKYRYASKPPQMLLTHPLPESRVTETEVRLQNYVIRPVATSLSFQLVRARIAARYSNYEFKQGEDVLLRRYNQATDPVIKKASAYGLALIYTDNHQIKKAHTYLDPLLKEEPNNLFYLDCFTDLSLAQGKASLAIKTLKQALKIKPQSAVLDINLANALISNKEFDEAITILQKQTFDKENAYVTWQLLSEAYAKAQNRIGELSAFAELSALKGQWDRALDYYAEASQLAPLGSLEIARIDARIDELRVEREKFRSLD